MRISHGPLLGGQLHHTIEPLSHALFKSWRLSGLDAADVDKLMAQLDALVRSGNTVIVVEHDMRVVAASDWVMDNGPDAGEEGGYVVPSSTPAEVSQASASRTAPHLKKLLA